MAWGSVVVLATSPVEAAPSASSAPPSPGLSSQGSPPSESSEASPAPVPPSPAAVGNARAAIERSMTELGTLLTRARQAGDMVRVACVQDKRDRADVVLEVATGEILVLQDPTADAQTRAFAGAKLSEAADRISGLVAQARACQGGGDDSQRTAQNEANQPKTVIPADPTASSPIPRLPPRIDPRPPVASAVL
ncbi:MAG TPA: hypothetical protein VIK91_03875 [Nannocystis sp.]